MSVEARPARATELLDAAVQEFLENGYAAVGVREITERTGVSHGTFYNYFDSKRHVLSVLIERDTSILLDHLAGAVDALDAPVTVAGLREAMRQANLAVLQEIEDRLDVYRFLLIEVPGVDEDTLERYQELYRQAARRCGTVLEPAYTAGLIDPSLPRTLVAEAWLSYLLGAMAAMVNDVEVTSPEQSAQVVVDLLLSGARCD